MIVVCIVPLIPTVMMMGGSMVHPSWVSNGCRVAYFMRFLAIASLGRHVLGPYLYGPKGCQGLHHEAYTPSISYLILG